MNLSVGKKVRNAEVTKERSFTSYTTLVTNHLNEEIKCNTLISKQGLPGCEN